MKRLLKPLLVLVLLATVAELLRRRPAPPSASPTAPPTPAPEADTPRRAPTPTEPWVAPDADGACPPGYPIKAKLVSKIFHVPGGAFYDRTIPDRCYASPVAAEADGLRPSKR